MRLEIHLFAGIRDSVGHEVVSIEVLDGARAADVREELVRRFPDSQPLIAVCRVAVDQAYATDAQPIEPGAEIALIPPVSGG